MPSRRIRRGRTPKSGYYIVARDRSGYADCAGPFRKRKTAVRKVEAVRAAQREKYGSSVYPYRLSIRKMAL
jgi:hypothetical protein